MIKAEFTYIETDVDLSMADESEYISGLTFENVIELIKEHNEYFETDYQSISDFNNSELYREILIDIKND